MHDLNFCRRISVYDDWSGVAVHIALDNVVILDDISKYMFFVGVCVYALCWCLRVCSVLVSVYVLCWCLCVRV